MDRTYTFSIVTDGRMGTTEVFAVDDAAAHDQVLMSTEALKDYALRGLPLRTVTVNGQSITGETIFEARVAVT
jgi:hypothetical protein